MKKIKLVVLFLIIILLFGIGTTVMANPVMVDPSDCNHEFVEKVTKKATCSAQGEKATVCTLCGWQKEITKTSKEAHNYTENNWDYDSRNHWKICTYCKHKNETSTTTHSFKNGMCETCHMEGCTSDKMLFDHIKEAKEDYSAQDSEHHTLHVTCTICNVTKTTKNNSHYFKNGICSCGYIKETDTTSCNITNTVPGHKHERIGTKINSSEPNIAPENSVSYSHDEEWKCSKCNTSWTLENQSHIFINGTSCDTCGYIKKEGNSNTCDNNNHRFDSFGICINCTEKLKYLQGKGTYFNWKTWASYTPENQEPDWQNSVTIYLNYPPRDENGNYFNITMECTSFERHNAEWHKNIAKKYKLKEKNYTEHLSVGRAISSESCSIKANISGNKITFNNIPKGRYYTYISIGGTGVSIPLMRYTSSSNLSISDNPGPQDTPTLPSNPGQNDTNIPPISNTYTIIIRHVDLTTGTELHSEQKGVNEDETVVASTKDFDGYNFSYVEHSNGNTSNEEKVTITNIKEDSVITFYYIKFAKICVFHYDRSKNDLISKEIYSSLEKDFSYNGFLSVSRLSDTQLESHGTGYEYDNDFEFYTYDKQERGTTESVTIYNITSDTYVWFYYSKPASVKVIGRVVTAPYHSLYENDLEKIKVTPQDISKEYTPKKVDSYKYVGYVIEDKPISNLDALPENMKRGNKATITLSNTQTYKLITFLYEPTSGITVEHKLIIPEKHTSKNLIEPKTIMAAPNERINAKNDMITRNGLLNYALEIDGQKVDIPESMLFTKKTYSQSVITKPNKITKVIFYYVSPKVEIEHRFEDKIGNLLKPVESDPSVNLDKEVKIKSRNLKDENYVNKKVILDGADIAGIPSTLRETYTVSVKPNGPDNRKVVMIYVYQKLPDKDDTPTDSDKKSEYTPVTCDPTVSNSNVLVDSNVTIVIPNHGVHTDFGEDAYYNKLFAKQKLVKFPFEVYYNGELKAKDTWIEVANRNDISREGNNDGKYEIGIPAWIEKGKYTVDVRVVATSGTEANEREQSNDIFNNGAIAYNEVEINVVGKIYDFTITNLEGDTVWSKYLFENQNKEYKTSTLPIGQANVVPTSYKYGMKLGSTFLYSINTLGVSNTKVQILPKVYYVEKNGGTAVDVTNKLQYKTEKGFVNFDSIAVSLSTKINKQTRMTAEVRNEVSKSMAMKAFVGYGQDTNASRKFGTYNKLLIDNSLRLPYVGYVSTLTKSSDKNFDKVMTSASHWYAEYKLPNTLAMKENSGNDKTVRKDGFYVVCFKIESKDTNGNTYLKYESQYVGNQWKNEGGAESTLTIKLPLTAQASNATTSINVTDGYYPVAIYQSNISVSEDYEISGTH